MKILWEKGRKGKKDRLIKVTTEDKELVTIYKVALLVNQLAINELIINEDAIKRNKKFFFKNSIIDVIEMAERGIDFGNKESEDEIIIWCNKHLLKYEKIEKELKRLWQSKLEEF